jgi:demethylmenaquinone methyltransferase / 2-methoxy-6-polyprenyl-1,4-benzoquinol methylase
MLPAGPAPTTTTSKRSAKRVSYARVGDTNRFAQELFDALPRRYDSLAEVLSLGQNRRWRRAMVDHVVASPARLVLDVASGTAGVAIQLAQRSGAQVVGLDLTEQMLRRGQANVARAGETRRVALVVGQAEQLPFPDAAFDGLTFTYLLRYVAGPFATLEELARVVKPGAPVASLEFLVPPHPFWRAWWWLYTRAVLPAAGWVTGGREWYRVGRFLGPNISGHYQAYPLDWHREAWEKAGFRDVGVRVMSLGGGLVMWGTRA